MLRMHREKVHLPEKAAVLCLSFVVFCTATYKWGIASTQAKHHTDLFTTTGLLYNVPTPTPTWPELGWNAYFANLASEPQRDDAITVVNFLSADLSAGIDSAPDKDCTGDHGSFPCAESVYLAQQASAVGEALLRYVNKEKIERMRARDYLSTDCGTCNPTPYVVSKRCAWTCRRALRSDSSSLNAKCYFCSHWGVSVTSEGSDSVRALWFMPLLTQVSNLVEFFITKPQKLRKHRLLKWEHMQEKVLRKALVFTFNEIDHGRFEAVRIYE